MLSTAAFTSTRDVTRNPHAPHHIGRVPYSETRSRADAPQSEFRSSLDRSAKRLNRALALRSVCRRADSRRRARVTPLEAAGRLAGYTRRGFLSTDNEVFIVSGGAV